MLFRNNLNSTVVLMGGRYKILPHGYKDPRTGEPLDVLDIPEKDMEDYGIKQFIESKKIERYPGLTKEEPKVEEVKPKVEKVESKTTEAAKISEVVKVGEGVTIQPVEVEEKEEKVPDLTASITGEPMKVDEEIKTEIKTEIKPAEVAPIVEKIEEPKEELKVVEVKVEEPKVEEPKVEEPVTPVSESSTPEDAQKKKRRRRK